MVDDAAARASKFAAHYESGFLTPSEVVVKLVLLAAEEDPASLAPALPAALVGEIGEACRRPPRDASESPRIFGFGVTDEAAWRERTSRAWYAGAWAWHRYLHPGAGEMAANRARGG
jgi:hypothetical protein